MSLEAAIAHAIDTAPRVHGTGIQKIGSAGEVPRLETIEEVTAGLSYAAAVLQRCIPVEDVTRHEGQHEYAWRAMGAHILGFGIRFVRMESDQGPYIGFALFVEAHAPGATKLHIAAAAAYPEDPSLGDLYLVRECGFSLDQVAEQAIANNQVGDTYILIPLSYVPS